MSENDIKMTFLRLRKNGKNWPATTPLPLQLDFGMGIIEVERRRKLVLPA
jgi:hypothetical protein